MMRITKLELRNFRNLARLDLDGWPAHVLVVGPNARGKSSIIDGISWALTGKARGLDGAGRGASALVRDGQPNGGVRVWLEGIGAVTRQAGAEGSSLEIAASATKVSKGNPQRLEAVLYDKLGASEPMILAALDGGRLLTMDHKEAKAQLFSVAPIEVRPEDDPRLKLNAPISIQDLDGLYKIAYTERAGAKAIDAATVVPAPPSETPQDMGPLEARLSERRATEKALLETRGHVVGKRESLLDRLAILQRQLETVTPVAATRADLETRIAMKETALTTKRQALALFDEQQLRVTAADSRSRQQLLAESVMSVTKHSPSKGCVLHSEIPCLTDAKEFQKHRKAMKTQIAEAEKRATIAADHLHELQVVTVSIGTLEAERRALDRQLEEATRAQAQSEEIQTALAGLASELEGMADQSGDRGAIEQQLVEVRQKIAKGEAIIAQQRDWHQQQVRHDQAVLTKQQTTAKVAECEERCQILGPNGVRVKVLARALETFHAAINARLEPYGYRLEFQVEPWAILVNGRSSELLSTSEKLRVGMAFSFALSDLAGLHFVALDNVDWLDKANRRIFAEILRQWPGQALICLTKDDDWAPGEAADDEAIYRLTAAGTAERLGVPVLA